MTATKRRGRPPKLEEDRASVNLTIRLRPALYEEIRSDAEKSGRSISAQAEVRLLHREPAGDDVARLVGMVVNAVERRAGKSWAEDQDVKKQCRVAADFALSVLFDLPPAIDTQLAAEALEIADGVIGRALVVDEDDAKAFASVVGSEK